MPKRLAGNTGTISLKSRRRSGDPMRAFDAMPLELRNWLRGAVLPWRPGSVSHAYAKALSQYKSSDRALAELDKVQARLIARDAERIWGFDHPGTLTGLDPR